MATSSTTKKSTSTKKKATPKVNPIQLDESGNVVKAQPKEKEPVKNPNKRNMVRIYIPLDPTDVSNHQVWERCFLGKNYIIKRGVEATVPDYIANLIAEQTRIEIRKNQMEVAYSKMKDLGEI